MSETAPKADCDAPLHVYAPDSRFRARALEAALSLTKEIVSYRSHIRTLFASEFENAYRGTALGVFWNFVLPVVQITVYILLVSLRVLPRIEGIPPAVYISFNVTLWHLLTGMLRQPIRVILSRNTTMMKTAMPLSAAVVSSFAQLTFDTVVRIVFVLGMMVFWAAWPAWTAPLALLTLLAGAVFCLGLGLGLAVLNVIYPDIDRVVNVVLQYGIFLSGVIFPISSMPRLAVLEDANPFNVFIHAARELTFDGTLTHPLPFLAWTIAGVVLLAFSARFFYVMEYRLRGFS